MAEEKQSEFGFIQWEITGNLLQQFKDAEHKQAFYSPQFRTISETIWRIIFYPRGDTSPEDCSIYLECVKLNDKKQRIGVNYSLDIMELDWTWRMGSTFSNHNRTWGRSKVFKPERLDSLGIINIKCFAQETMDVSHGETYFEWKVDNHLIQQWKHANYSEVFNSPKFNVIG
eukprot:276582_1